MTKVFQLARIVALLAPLVVSNMPVAAHAESHSQRIHAELRALRDGLLEAVRQGDFARAVGYFHPNSVFIPENGQLIRKSSGIREFYERALTGSTSVLKRFSIDAVEVEELSILFGDNTAVAFGTATTTYEPTIGNDFTLPSRWTATLVNENGHWLVASFQNTVNVYDNPLREPSWSGLVGRFFGFFK